MKGVQAVVVKVRGTGLRCALCKGANWRRRMAKFMITGELLSSGRNPFLLQLPNGDMLTGTTVFVCREHLRDAVLEVWK